MKDDGWIGVDLDGTLAVSIPGEQWDGTSIGKPVPLMVKRVKEWRKRGIDVRIFTARVGPPFCKHKDAGALLDIQAWCKKHLGEVLPVTATKDFRMIQLWDDRAIGVTRNKGTKRIHRSPL